MKSHIPLLLCVLFLFTGTAVSAADLKAGRNHAAPCTSCHGYKGVTANEEWPNLAGQKPGYLAKQLRAYRDGKRVDPLMSPMAAGLTDEDIDNIAAYFNSL